MLRKNPGFAAAAVVTLALGIGANTAIFSVCNAVLFKPLPYAEPDRIVMLWERMRRRDSCSTVAPANFVDWRSASRSFSDMAASVPVSAGTSVSSLADRAKPARLAGATVSSNFFSVLGVRFALGRNFLPEEDRPGQNRVAILSHRVWQERFGAKRDIAGSRVTLNDNSYTVVGVLPADFQFASNAARFSGAQPGRHLGADRARSAETAARHASAACHREAQARRGPGAGAGGAGRHRGEPGASSIRRTTATRGSRRFRSQSK